MPTGAIIGGIAGGALSAGASIYGAGKQSDAAANALALQKQMFDTSQKNITTAQGQIKPFVDTGTSAMYSLAQLYGLQTPNGAGGQPFNDNALEAFRKSPDYDFRMKEGMRALDFSDSAKGMLGSRGHLNNTVSFGQGLASQGLGDYTSRLLALSNIGAGAAGTSLSGALGAGNQSVVAGNSMANTTMGQGQANASGVIGASNAINSSIGSTSNGLLMYNALNNRSAYGGGGNDFQYPGQSGWGSFGGNTYPMIGQAA